MQSLIDEPPSHLALVSRLDEHTIKARIAAGMVNDSVRIFRNPKIPARTTDSIKKLCGQRLGGRRGRMAIVVIGGAPATME